MLLQVTGVGKQKIKYKDHSDIEFDTLDNYILFAKKAIAKFANSIFNGLSKKMLNDEDAISSVANAIMMADWRWDENYNSVTGTKKNRYSYRNQCALWAIQTYASKIYHKPKKVNNIYSLDQNNDSTDLCNYDFLQDSRTAKPECAIIDQEEQQSLQQLIEDIFALDLLSDKQKDYIHLYYFENYTFEKIGKKYNITREAVRQGLNKAILLIRGLLNNETV